MGFAPKNPASLLKKGWTQNFLVLVDRLYYFTKSA